MEPTASGDTGPARPRAGDPRPARAAPTAADTPAAPSPAAAPRRPRWVWWLALVGLWTLLGALSGIQVSYFYWRYEKVPLGNVFLWQMIDWYFWIPATPAILWLGRRFALERAAWLRSAAIHLATAIAFSIAHLANSTLIGKLIDAPRYKTRSFYDILQVLFLNYIHLDIVTYWAILAAGLAYAYHSKFREGQLVAARLESQLANAQLQALKMQLHPHFLFNTLHAISVLARKRETDTAVRMLTGLSDLLRATLDSAARQLVPLRQELALLDRYLDIEQIRFRDRLTVTTSVEPGLDDAAVPNLILQPLAENAIRHGIAPRADGGTIAVTARRRGDRLVLEMRDDGVGVADAADDGVGLGNVRARLEQLYPGDHRFVLADLSRAAGGDAEPDGDTRGAVAVIDIPLRTVHDGGHEPGQGQP